MKFTLSWLKDHLETDANLAEVVDAMTRIGMEVEQVDDPTARLAAFSVARVIEARPHPNADRLRVCQVETADGRKEIVCGAPNARAGLLTAYAPVGCYIPGTGVTLEPRAVRGVVSNGMLCSGAELGLSGESDGILELPSAPVGEPLAEALGLEAVIDFEVTPNRPDWLGVAGIARDLGAAGLGQIHRHTGGQACRRLPVPDRGAARGSGSLSGLRRAADPRRSQRPLAGVAAATADQRRPAADQRPGGHHQLSNHRPRAAAARL